MILNLGTSDAIAQRHRNAILCDSSSWRLYIIGIIAQRIVQLSAILQGLDTSSSCGCGQLLVSSYGILLIEPVAGLEFLYILVIVAIKGFSIFGMRFYLPQIQLTCIERRPYHVHVLVDDVGRRAWCHLRIESSFGCEIKFARLQGNAIELRNSMMQQEIKIVAHIRSSLTGALYDVLFRIVGSRHVSRGGLGLIEIEVTARFIKLFVDFSQLQVADGLTINIIQEHHAVSREPITFRQGDTHVQLCRQRLARNDNVLTL